jgi:predicted MPP superfamily phosphohydrolase
MKAFKIIVRIFSIFLLVTFSSGIFFYINNEDYLITKTYSFTSSKLPKNYNKRIVQISDWHNHDLSYWEKKNFLSEVDAAKPDIIVSTGDLIDNHTNDEDFARLNTIFSHFQSKNYPTYYVDGNHEAHIKPLQFRTRIHEILANNGAIALEDTSVSNNLYQGKRVSIDNAFTLSGLTDPGYTVDDGIYFYEQYGNTESQLTNLDNDLDSSKFNIMLSHRPENWRLINTHSYDLTLSGHTHGGQIRLFNYGLLAWGGFKGTPISGQFFKDNKSLVVSSGLGKAYGAPVRYNCPAEIVVIELKGA